VNGERVHFNDKSGEHELFPKTHFELAKSKVIDKISKNRISKRIPSPVKKIINTYREGGNKLGNKLYTYGIEFTRPDPRKERLAFLFYLLFPILGHLEGYGHKIDSRSNPIGPKEQQNWAIVYDKILYFAKHLVGRGETLYSTVNDKPVGGFNPDLDITSNYLVNLLPWIIPAYLMACTVVEGYDLVKRRWNKFKEGRYEHKT